MLGRRIILGSFTWLVLGSSSRLEAQTVEISLPPASAADEPAATITDIKGWRSAGWFLAGVASGFFAHEAGHVVANLVQGNVPHFQGILGFGFIPFFTIAPRITCVEDRCVKYDGSPFTTGVAGKVTITSAGFNVQHITDEILLSHTPRLRYRVAPFRKGLLAFNILLSVGYAISAMTRIETPRGRRQRHRALDRRAAGGVRDGAARDRRAGHVPLLRAGQPLGAVGEPRGQDGVHRRPVLSVGENRPGAAHAKKLPLCWRLRRLGG